MQVLVVNNNTHPYRETFKGRDINIPPGGHVEMDQGEAVLFLGTMPDNVKLDKHGQQEPACYKRLKIVSKTAGGRKTPAPLGFRCERDGELFATEKELNRHIADNYREDLVDEDAIDEAIKKPAKRRGRPPKKVSA